MGKLSSVRYKDVDAIGSATKNSEAKSNCFQSKIINGDVIDLLGKLHKEQKFDIIIADPPYNIGKDFGNNSDQMEINCYIKWVKKWLVLCLDLLADNGLIYVYGFPEILARVSAQYPLERQRLLAWHYTNKVVPSSSFWQRSYESILCLWRGKRPSLEIDQIREPYSENYLKYSGKIRKETNGRFSDGSKKSVYKVHSNGALPKDVIKIPALAGGAGNLERWFMCRSCDNKVYPPKQLNKHKEHDILKHPTQKPMGLTKKLIQSRINGNKGRVLVPFAGSGSKCMVAKFLNIEFLGMELNPEYVEYANKWLETIECICID